MVKKLTDNQRGDLLETIVRSILEAGGYEVEGARRSARMIGKGRFISEKIDFFNCDIWGIHKATKPRFVQVTTVHNVDKRERVSAHHWNPDYTDVEFWQFLVQNVNREFRIFKLERVRGVDNWVKERDLPVGINLHFETVDGWRHRKGCSMWAVCDFLGWNLTQYKAFVKEMRI